MSAFELEWLLDPGIAEVGDTHQIERCDAGRLVMLAHQRRLASHLARAVPRAGTVGHPAVEGHADDADVDARQVLLIRCAEERRYPGKARPQLRIGELGIADGYLDHDGLYVVQRLCDDRLGAAQTKLSDRSLGRPAKQVCSSMLEPCHARPWHASIQLEHGGPFLHRLCLGHRHRNALESSPPCGPRTPRAGGSDRVAH